jgi:hypothetical protein
MGKTDMSENPIKSIISNNNGESYALKYMDFSQVSMVDEALAAIGEYGEVRLIVERGRLRFLVTQRSFDALKWQPGAINE